MLPSQVCVTGGMSAAFCAAREVSPAAAARISNEVAGGAEEAWAGTDEEI